MKALETVYSKKPLQCWVAEAYEPYFSNKESDSSLYRVVHQEAEINIEDAKNCRKTVKINGIQELFMVGIFC